MATTPNSNPILCQRGHVPGMRPRLSSLMATLAQMASPQRMPMLTQMAAPQQQALRLSTPTRQPVLRLPPLQVIMQPLILVMVLAQRTVLQVPPLMASLRQRILVPAQVLVQRLTQSTPMRGDART